MQPAEFLRCLWGSPLNERARIQIWHLADRRCSLLRSHAGAEGLGGSTDVYTGVALTHAGAPTGTRRPAARDARGIAGLWLDIDINGGPDDKTGAAPDLNTARALARTITKPTVLVHSGRGLHAWYLFDDGPWIFRDHAELDLAARAATGWIAMHRAHAGFQLDSVGDLARLLRLPGTVNAKGGASRPVTVIETGPRHDRARLIDDAARHSPALAAVAHDGPAVVDLRGSGDVAERLQILLDEDEHFAATFYHARPLPRVQGAGLSEYDMSLAAQLAQAGGWTDPEIAAVIAAHRAHHGDTSGKAQRASYLRLTIGNARARTLPTERRAA